MIVRQFTSRGVTSHLCARFKETQNRPVMARPSSDLAAFREVFSKAKHVAILTGAGVSAESGVPTFRGEGGFWRKWQAQVNTPRMHPKWHPVPFIVHCSSPLSPFTLSSSCPAPLALFLTPPFLYHSVFHPHFVPPPPPPPPNQDLATPGAFSQNPSRVWEFYHYRREVMLTKSPNSAHVAIAECEARLQKQGRRVTVITQNIDELHRRAGSTNILEMHGSLFNTRCMSCGHVGVNHKSPICAALEGKGAPDPNTSDAQIPPHDLPRCEQGGCSGLLRPNVVWFGETLDSDILTRVEEELDLCDLCLVVGTSSIVYPAAMFAPQVAARGIPVAEFNMEETPATMRFRLYTYCSPVSPSPGDL
uniref:NAD-dependent protein deacylase sirtuin-5, mitochondrial n=1 Tax=Oncorhynchus mykiss TaxID=8022 RepID=A0A8K9WLW2_ONCMY